jgi:hypothetical protein
MQYQGISHNSAELEHTHNAFRIGGFVTTPELDLRLVLRGGLYEEASGTGMQADSIRNGKVGLGD